jgi:hypothetical protein
MDNLDNTLNETSLLDTGDHIYYNVTITATENSFDAVFNENRTTPILDKGDNYDLSVIRFNLPTQAIPIFLWRYNEWYLSIAYKTVVYTREIPFIPNQTFSPTFPKYFKEAIWQYQDYVDCINLCYKQLFADFITDPIYLTIPLVDRPTKPPKMTYDAANKRCSVYYPLQYDITKPDPIYYYFNAASFEIFNAFQNYGNEIDPILSHYLNVKDNKNNIINVGGTDYIRLTEEFNELFLWNDFEKFIFETDKIPVNNEYLAGQKNITRKVLTDFIPSADINDQSNVQFYPLGPIRFYSMFSGLELKDVDIRIFWETKDGFVVPLYVDTGDRITIKLYFKKKGPMISNVFF